MHPYFKTNLRKFKLTFKILHVIVIPGKYKDWSKSNASFITDLIADKYINNEHKKVLKLQHTLLLPESWYSNFE